MIRAVHKVAYNKYWTERFRAVSIEVADANKGLANSVIDGATKVIGAAGRAIVVEDDLLVAPDFLVFMNDCLNFYHIDQSVGSITGFSPLAEAPTGYRHDVMAVPRNSSQGWGTWLNRWREVDWSARDAHRVWKERELRRLLNSAGSDRALRLRRQLDGKIDSWSIRFGLYQVIAGKVTIYPVHNRILNIGYDGSGVHSGVGEPKNEQIDVQYAGMKPVSVEVDDRVLRAFRKIYSGPWYKRAIRNARLGIGWP